MAKPNLRTYVAEMRTVLAAESTEELDTETETEEETEDDSTEKVGPVSEDEMDTSLNALADLIEGAGFEVPDDIEDLESFLAAVETDVLESEDLDEALGAKIKAAWGKAKKAVHGFMQKHRQNKRMKQTGKSLGKAIGAYNKMHPAH